MSEEIMTKDLSSVTDKKFNNQLFYVYEKLIPIFEDIENKSYEIAQLEMKIVKNRSKKLSTTLVPLWIIISIILLCVGLLEIIPGFLNLFKWIMDINAGLCLLVYSVSCFLLTYLIFLMIQIAICYPAAARQETKASQLKQYVNQICIDYEKYTQFVPPSYRYSHAMKHFVNAYVNGKVENTKEAMISYDEDMHRLKMETTHIHIIRQLEMIQRQQVEVLRQQQYIQNMLDVDSALIILNAFK